MEINLKIDTSLNFRTHTVDGVVTKEDLFPYLSKLYSSSKFDPRLNVLWDFRRADLSSFLFSDVVRVRDHIEKNLSKPKPSKAALVVDSQLDFTLTTMFETLIKGPEVSSKVFLDIDDAVKWLSL